MASGRLRHKIEIVSRSTSKDKYGALIDTTVKQFDIRCNVRVLSGSELIKSGLQLGTEFISILCRYDKRIEYTHLMQWRGKDYTIEVLRPDPKNQYMTITGSREVRNG